jgi:RNA polymerase sigma factor (sigma-70 family)
MSNRDRLAKCLEPATAAALAALYRLGVPPKQVAEQTTAGISFAYLKALETQKRFVSQKHCRNWLVRVAVNHAIQTFRTEGGRRKILQKLHTQGRASDAELTPRPSPLQPFLEAMKDFLPRLSDEDRLVIELRFLEGLPLKALARRFNCSITKVHRWIARVLDELRALMTAGGMVPDGWESAR